MVEAFETAEALSPVVRKVDWQAMTEHSRAHPEVWTRTPVTLDQSMAKHIRAGRNRQVDPAEFEARSARDQDETSPTFGLYHVYIRPWPKAKRRGR